MNLMFDRSSGTALGVESDMHMDDLLEPAIANRVIDRDGLVKAKAVRSALEQDDSAAICRAIGDMIGSLEVARPGRALEPTRPSYFGYLFAAELGGRNISDLVGREEADGLVEGQRRIVVDDLRRMLERCAAGQHLSRAEKMDLYHRHFAFAANSLSAEYWFLDPYYAPSIGFAAAIDSLLSFHDVVMGGELSGFPLLSSAFYAPDDEDAYFQPAYVVPYRRVRDVFVRLSSAPGVVGEERQSEANAFLSILRECDGDSRMFVVYYRD